MKTIMDSAVAGAIDAPIGPPPMSAARFEQFGVVMLFAVAGAVQFSIAIAQFLLALAVICWIALLVTRRERFQAPSFFWPLLAYAAATIASAAFSADQRTSLIDCKQLVLFVLVPLTYRFGGLRGSTVATAGRAPRSAWRSALQYIFTTTGFAAAARIHGPLDDVFRAADDRRDGPARLLFAATAGCGRRF
jgi:hypothetical protein